MIFDNFDATMLVANPLLLPMAGAPEALETGSGPTLDDALREFDSVDRAPDLWVTDAMRGTASPVTVEEAGDNGIASAEPSDEEANDATSPQTDANAPQADANVPQDHPLIKEKLSFAEMGHMIARQYDSTDYSWEEMSSGDYDWAFGNFRADVYAAVLQFTAGATSQPQADLLAQAYLNSIGLGSLVHVGTPPPDDGAIVVTAQTYYHPTIYMPPLWTDHDLLGSFDPGSIFDLLDVSAQTVAVDADVEMTAENRLALDRLNVVRGRVTEYLHSLPPNGVFITPKGTITVSELLVTWALVDFHITGPNTSYAANGIAGHPGAGASHYNGGNPVFETSITNLIGFTWSEEKALAYILHELAHVTWVGNQYFIEIRPPGGPEPSVADFGANERFANDLASLMAATMEHPFLPGWPINEWGVTADSPMTFVPNLGEGGGGGDGGGHGDVPWQ
jgi:hypothetical protein